MHRPWITTFAVVLVTAVVTAFLVSPFGGTIIFEDRREMRLMSERVKTLEELADDQDRTIQAMKSEVDELHGEVRRAREDLKAAQKESSVELLSADLKAATHRLANESAQKVKALHDVGRLEGEIADLKSDAVQLRARIAELEKGR